MADSPGDDRTLRGDATPLPDSHHVDVAAAEAQFHELERALSVRSRQADSDDHPIKERDLEAGEKREETAFDLKAYLSSSNDAYQKAGLAHKHVGVTWENLQVDVVGGVGQKVG
ncbi:hypothetical protein ACG7TL_000691 [Trametes sanguinea]